MRRSIFSLPLNAPGFLNKSGSISLITYSITCSFILSSSLLLERSNLWSISSVFSATWPLTNALTKNVKLSSFTAKSLIFSNLWSWGRLLFSINLTIWINIIDWLVIGRESVIAITSSKVCTVFSSPSAFSSASISAFFKTSFHAMASLSLCNTVAIDSIRLFLISGFLSSISFITINTG